MNADVRTLLDVLSSRPGANEDYMRGASDNLTRRLQVVPETVGADYRRGWREATEIRPYGFEQRREPAKFSTIDSNAWKSALRMAKARREGQSERVGAAVSLAERNLRQRIGESRFNEVSARQSATPQQETMRLRL